MRKVNWPEFLSSLLILFLCVALGAVVSEHLKAPVIDGLIFGFVIYLTAEKLYDRKSQKKD